MAINNALKDPFPHDPTFSLTTQHYSLAQTESQPDRLILGISYNFMVSKLPHYKDTEEGTKSHSVTGGSAMQGAVAKLLRVR